MHAEIVTTGSELLLGQLVDTNSAFIARTLRRIGLNLYYKTTVGDNEDRMVEALRIAMNRSAVIITTGGLGPTVDDVTRPAVARATGRDLEFRPELLAQIEERFKSFGVTMTENNRRQAFVPRGAIAIENPVGTAPSFIVEHEQAIVISLPGVPGEMEYLLARHVTPYLQRKLGLHETIFTRTIHTAGLGESRIDAEIADLQRTSNPTVGLSAHPGQTDVRIAAKSLNEEQARALIAPVEAQVRERLKAYVYGADEETLEGIVVRRLAERGLQLVSLETGTGGQLAGRLSAAPGSEGVYGGGQVLPRLPVMLQAAAEALRSNQPAVTLGLAALAETRGDHQLALAAVLATPQGIRQASRSFSGQPRQAAEWTANAALGLVWRYLAE